MPNPFTYIFRVRYAECDPQGVVFNARYVDYADLAFTEYIRAIFGGYQNLLDAGLDMQLVNLNVSWQAPARADQVLKATVFTQKIGTTSVNLEMQISDYESAAPVATISIVYVAVTPDELVKQAVPAKVREKLLAGAAGVVISHAGIEVQ